MKISKKPKCLLPDERIKKVGNRGMEYTSAMKRKVFFVFVFVFNFHEFKPLGGMRLVPGPLALTHRVLTLHCAFLRCWRSLFRATPRPGPHLVSSTLTPNTRWVWRPVLSRCLVKEKKEALIESGKHGVCWRHSFWTKAGRKQQPYSLITFSVISFMVMSLENKQRLPF